MAEEPEYEVSMDEAIVRIIVELDATPIETPHD